MEVMSRGGSAELVRIAGRPDRWRRPRLRRRSAVERAARRLPIGRFQVRATRATISDCPIKAVWRPLRTDIAILPPLPGDPANLLRLHIECICQLQHLGRTTAIAEQTVTFTGPTTAVASNTSTYTAANGDQLFATWSGTSVSDGPLVTFSGPERYVGGTGFSRRHSGRHVAGSPARGPHARSLDRDFPPAQDDFTPRRAGSARRWIGLMRVPGSADRRAILFEHRGEHP
jgi:hypothetical protein